MADLQTHREWVRLNYWIRSVKPHDDGLIPTGKNEHFENAFPKCVAKREISVRIGGKPIFY